MFLYCGNNPVNNAVSTQMVGSGYASAAVAAQAVEMEIYPTEISFAIPYMIPVKLPETPVVKQIRYDVPLYNQNQYNLCWAFCQIMVEDYQAGVLSTNEQATSRAIDLAIKAHGANGIGDREKWDRGWLPTNVVSQSGDRSIRSLADIYNALCSYGPLYASYYSPDLSIAHVVVITGVDVTNGIVYTNNPQGAYGKQTYEEFLNGYVGAAPNTVSLHRILIPT